MCMKEVEWELSIYTHSAAVCFPSCKILAEDLNSQINVASVNKAILLHVIPVTLKDTSPDILWCSCLQ